MALLLFGLKRDRCIHPSVELPGLRAFVRAISPFSVCLAGISLVRLSGLPFVHALSCSFFHSLLSFVRFVAFHSVT